VGTLIAGWADAAVSAARQTARPLRREAVRELVASET
jgi:hypothetical protein